jgi:hypothetical protein
MVCRTTYWLLPVIVMLTVLPAAARTAEPGLVWSSFLGGGENDKANAMAVDHEGNIFLVGSTRSLEFPATAEAFDTSYGDKTDAFVARIDAGGGGLAYATYLGGNGGDRGYAIDVDSSGSACVTGFTYSGNFPVTAGAFDTEHNSPGGVYQDIFIARLQPNGSALLYSTFLGGSLGEGGYALILCADGSLIVAGDTQSEDFPVTPEAYDTTHHGIKDVFVARLAAGGGALEYATFAGGSLVENFETIVRDDAGSIYIVGETKSDDLPTTEGAFDRTYNQDADAFVLKLNASGDSLEYGSYIGSSLWDRGTGVAVDESGCLYLTGYTTSTGFPHTFEAYDPTHNGRRDAFVVKIDIVQNQLIYGTFLGGDDDDRGLDIEVDDLGYAIVTGRTASEEFPTTPGAYDESHNGDTDAFVVRLGPSGDLLQYGTFLGGAGDEYGNDLVYAGADVIYLAGTTTSEDFPVTAGAVDPDHNGLEDVFALEFQLLPTPVREEIDPGVRPRIFTLQQNYPNPFNPSTTIEFTLPRDERVELRIYDIRGALVATLADGRRPAGVHRVRWNAADRASGVYFCVLQAGGLRRMRKMVLLK